jgi:hypothetical protein
MNAPETLHRTAAIALADLPPLRGALHGGIFVGLTTDKEGRHFAVTLLPDKPAKDDLTWKAAIAWADSAGGVLPTRPVAALLFANAKDQFEEEWHWTSEAHERYGSAAWFQDFDGGYQDYFRKSDELRARAVRLIQLTA